MAEAAKGIPAMKTHTSYAFAENSTDFHTSKDEGHLHHAELANLAAMAGSILHQVGATEVANPELTTLVNFNGTNGFSPWAGLIADDHGNLFGTTIYGGVNNLGTVFEIVKTAHGYASTPTILASFNGTDGAYPWAGLIADARGDLFGTTSAGGAWFGNTTTGLGANGGGTVFEIAKTATGCYASTPTTLFSFSGDANGANPFGSLIADARGDLFGTTIQRGANGGGTVFEITNSGFITHKTPSCSVLETHDHFVFDPKLGENTSVHSNPHDQTIDHAKSEFTQFAELLSQPHQDAANLPHDAADPVNHAATLSAQHAHHFLV